MLDGVIGELMGRKTHCGHCGHRIVSPEGSRIMHLCPTPGYCEYCGAALPIQPSYYTHVGHSCPTDGRRHTNSLWAECRAACCVGEAARA